MAAFARAVQPPHSTYSLQSPMLSVWQVGPPMTPWPRHWGIVELLMRSIVMHRLICSQVPYRFSMLRKPCPMTSHSRTLNCDQSYCANVAPRWGLDEGIVSFQDKEAALGPTLYYSVITPCSDRILYINLVVPVVLVVWEAPAPPFV